jgi:hypothetical protein
MAYDDHEDWRALALKHWQAVGVVETGNPWLTEDGIVDDTAIEVAVNGIRPVRLTEREARIAITRILLIVFMDELPSDVDALVAERLNCSRSEAARLVAMVIST